MLSVMDEKLAAEEEEEEEEEMIHAGPLSVT